MALVKNKDGETLIASNESQLAAFKKFGFEEVEEDSVKTIDNMNKAELVEYAKANNIEIDESSTKKDILAVIKAV